MTDPDVDVVVVGAGLAGLTAARDLEASGATVLILEARDRTGGRTLNHQLDNGEVVEIGGQWVGPHHDRLLAMAKELEVETFPTHNRGWHMLYIGGRIRRYRKMVPPRMSPLQLIDFCQAQLRLDHMARKVPLDEPWTAKRATRWDAMTLESWLRGAMVSRGGRDIMNLAVNAVFAADPGDLSLLHFLFYSRSGGLSRGLVTAQELRFVGGSQQLSIRQAKSLNAEVRLQSPVNVVRQDQTGVTVTSDEASLRCQRVIITAPPSLAGRIGYEPLLPVDRDLLTQSAPMGSVIKVLGIYDEPFWRSDGLSGQASSDVGPVRVVFDNSPPSGKPGILVGFAEASQARQLRRLSRIERRNEVLACFGRFFGKTAKNPTAYVEQDWNSEEWSRGCYGAFFPPGVWTGYGHSLRTPVGRVHWAGAETSLEWAGYMEGAVRSGERVAAEVIPLLSS
jgi:monoamine oxidase